MPPGPGPAGPPTSAGPRPSRRRVPPLTQHTHTTQSPFTQPAHTTLTPPSPPPHPHPVPNPSTQPPPPPPLPTQLTHTTQPSPTHQQPRTRTYHVSTAGERGWRQGLDGGWRQGLEGGWRQGLEGGWRQGPEGGWRQGLEGGWRQGLEGGWRQGLEGGAERTGNGGTGSAGGGLGGHGAQLGGTPLVQGDDGPHNYRLRLSVCVRGGGTPATVMSGPGKQKPHPLSSVGEGMAGWRLLISRVARPLFLSVWVRDQYRWRPLISRVARQFIGLLATGFRAVIACTRARTCHQACCVHEGSPV